MPEAQDNFSQDANKRVLIFVVAYNAEKTIAKVLSRIPIASLPKQTEVLVIDDSSSDRTVQAARDEHANLKDLKLTVLKTPVNQGYGGNQKIGYQYAIEKGFDVVALLHGDGQYAPERLPELIGPVLAGEADACFGSRMMSKGSARMGGMPLYKYLGNRILTIFQNCLLKTNLSEFHSGYRVYSVKALKQLPFKYNTSNFHFDTEIIIQLVLAKQMIKEVPIPTYYGDEICYVNGLAYAWHVVTTTLSSRLNKLGVGYQNRFDVHAGNQRYDLKLGYPSSHTYAIAAVRENSRVLDVACAQGLVARELVRKNCRVTGIDRETVDSEWLEKFVLADLDRGVPDGMGQFDYVLLLDCLEHLHSPEDFLETLRERYYSDKTRVIATVPNVAFFSMRLGLMAGQFNYGRQGILDLTHMRLFTFKSFAHLMTQSGYRITKMRGVPAPYPKAMGDNILSRFALATNRVMIALYRSMFSYQIYVEAVPLPPLSHLLKETLESGEVGKRGGLSEVGRQE